MEYYRRFSELSLIESIDNYPVTVVIGPRQCGKSTMVKQYINERKNSVYLDLERPSDIRKLDNAEWFLGSLKGQLVCIDEIQRKPELFPLIRSLVDEWDQPGCFLILGSASRDLLRQSSESLAGRISYIRLTPFLWNEIQKNHSMEHYFSAGGFPRSILAAKEDTSYKWREDFILTFLERDLLQWKNFTPAAMGRLWRMLAHINGQTVNYSELASSMGISSISVKEYIDLLASTYMVEVIQPWFSNFGKRLVKAPKIYIADSGITAALLGIHSFEELCGHPVIGAVWEQIVLTNLRGWFPDAEICYYRTTNGAETDFIINITGNIYAIECKVSLDPVLSKGNYLAFDDIAPKNTFIVTPAQDSWPLKPGIDVVSLNELQKRLV
ncbi:MAG: ATP-binding protein [Treponema sp.]|nr:ATP-binding protein [Treponema sp.]